MAIPKDEVFKNRPISRRLFRVSVEFFDAWIEEGLRNKKPVEGRIRIDLPFTPSPEVWKVVKERYMETSWCVKLETNGEEHGNAWVVLS